MNALDALLCHSIDYTGTFQPACLPFQSVVEIYAHHSTGPCALYLERLACASVDLPAFWTWVEATKSKLSVTAVIPTCANAKLALEQLDVTLRAISKLPSREFIDVLELRCPAELLGHNSQMRQFFDDAIRRISSVDFEMTNCMGVMPCFFEFPNSPTASPSNAWRESLTSFLETITAYNRTADRGNQTAGLKFRTGGTTPDAVPSCATLATVIDECCRANVFWKATAGLHQPLRHVDESLGAPVHGFVNLFAAAVLAKVHGLRSAQIEPILDDRDAANFRFAGDRLTWGKLSVTSEQITAARSHGLRSFGSCSFDEPIAGLRSQFGVK